MVSDFKIMSLREIEVKLKDRRLYVISKEIGISYPILKKMAMGVNRNYTLNTLTRISKYLSGNGENNGKQENN